MWENAIVIAARRAVSNAERIDESLQSNKQNLIGRIESNRWRKKVTKEEVPLE
jgi:hypothetical protein